MGEHPGRTPAQRRVLDEIGCGNHSPIMSKKTREKLLADGLIEELSPIVDRAGPFRIEFRQFQMPAPVHMAWCMSVEDDDHTPGPRL